MSILSSLFGSSIVDDDPENGFYHTLPSPSSNNLAQQIQDAQNQMNLAQQQMNSVQHQMYAQQASQLQAQAHYTQMYGQGLYNASLGQGLSPEGFWLSEKHIIACIKCKCEELGIKPKIIAKGHIVFECEEDENLFKLTVN